MKRLLISLFIFASVAILSGCCGSAGGCTGGCDSCGEASSFSASTSFGSSCCSVGFGNW